MARSRKSQPDYLDPAVIRQALTIGTDVGPQRLNDVLDDWQRRDFEAVDPALRRVMGQNVPDAKMRVLLKRGRGHSKTSDIGVMALTPLAGSPQRFEGIAASGDQDQSRLLLTAVERMIHHTPILSKLIEVQRNKIINVVTGSFIEAISADVATSWGKTVQLIAIDELAHWGPGGEGFWQSLFSTAGKTDCLLIIGSNAFMGAGSSWQWRVAETARKDPGRWYVNELDGCVASWIPPGRLEEQRLMLPDKIFRRVWLNQDVEESGDLLDAEDIAVAVKPGLRPMLGPRFNANRPAVPGVVLPESRNVDETPKSLTFLAGVDLSVRRDHTGVVVVGVDAVNQRIRLAEVHHWRPTRGKDIDLQVVEDTIADVHRRFRLTQVNYDPAQAAFLSQRLTRRGVPMKEVPFTAANCSKMANVLLSAFKEQRIDLYDHPQLIRDLKSLLIVETPTGGTKLAATRAADGSHADTAVALALAILDSREARPATSHWGGPVYGRFSAGSFAASTYTSGIGDNSADFRDMNRKYFGHN